MAPSVGIITFHFVRNFGGMLQAYALKESLKDQGCEVSLINYRPHYVESHRTLKLPTSRKNLRSNAIIAFHLKNKILHRIHGDREQDRKFTEFEREHLSPQTSLVHKAKKLDGICDDFDILVCGSDQIWNPPIQHGPDPAYYLKFGRSDAIRASYAASFGSSELPQEYRTQVSQYLDSLDYITVRERSGIDIVSSLTGRACEHMPDPTLLLDDYAQRFDGKLPASDGDYIFLYGLRSGEGVDATLQYVASKLGHRIIRGFNRKSTSRSTVGDVYPGPEEWVSYIQNASFVVTNSFHGTLFSILMKRPFITLSIGGHKSSLDVRARNVLELLGLESRFVSEFSPEKVDSLLKIPIAWDEVENRRLDLASKARRYLQQVIFAAKKSQGSE